ncbi:hypothetical protein TRICI_000529 [Trichomonascus ciferrii]|uniref:Plasma membrane fusion protein PRM1 n=1 Tax=Trichomonascus ciferrii TaxID=44093 RepID=A0A642VD73_9ASCO|nr:hypothetical protein TRICI_000529 [Trichomonascus ciferrii]
MIPDLPNHLKNVVPRGLFSQGRGHRRGGMGSGNTLPPSYDEISAPTVSEKITSFWNQKFNRGYKLNSYIGLGARLSQVWLNQYTIIIILLLVKVLLFKDSLSYALKSAEKHTMSTCTSTEDMVSEALSMPHYMAQGANELVTLGVEHSISALIKTLLLIITGVENLIIFSIEMIIGTYACLITAAINSSAGTAINATESVIDFVNDGLEDIADELEKGMGGLTKVVNGAGNVVEDVANLFTGGDTEIKDVNITVGKLHDFKIPDSVNEKLTELRDNLPTYDGVKNSTENLIRTPFDKLKSELNDSLHNKIQFNSKALVIPEKKTALFCNENGGIKDFYASLTKSVGLTTRIFIIVLILAAILACIPVAWREIRNWRWINECARRERDLNSYPDVNEKIAIIHDATYRGVVIAQDIAAKPLKTAENRLLIKWWVDYIFYAPALAVLLLSVCGFIVVSIQYIILYRVERALPEFKSSVQRLTGEVVDIARSEGINWSQSTNHELNSTEGSINNHVFGWVRTATDSVNDTLTSFQSSMNKTLHDDFDNTPLYDPISKVMYCVIGSKVEKAIEGLTWVHENAKVSLPRVNDTYLTDSSTGMNPQKVANSTATSMINILQALIDAYEKSLHLELYIATVLFCLWLLVALLGSIYCLWTRRSLIKDGLLNRQNPSHGPNITSYYSANPEIKQGIAFPGFRDISRKPTPLNDWAATDAFKAGSIYASSTTPNSPVQPRPETEICLKGIQKPLAVVVNQSPDFRKSSKGTTSF